jgi:undecaprenyl-diphosphatase
VFVTTTLFVDRARPPVHRLDTAPPTSSFPSGHTAAAIVLYIGLIIVVHRVWRRNAATIGVAVVLALVPVVVGLSRLSRGMHHPTDVIAGALLGTVALLVACALVGRAVARPGASDRTTGARKVRA